MSGGQHFAATGVNGRNRLGSGHFGIDIGVTPAASVGRGEAGRLAAISRELATSPRPNMSVGEKVAAKGVNGRNRLGTGQFGIDIGIKPAAIVGRGEAGRSDTISP